MSTLRRERSRRPAGGGDTDDACAVLREHGACLRGRRAGGDDVVDEHDDGPADRTADAAPDLEGAGQVRPPRLRRQTRLIRHPPSLTQGQPDPHRQAPPAQVRNGGPGQGRGDVGTAGAAGGRRGGDRHEHDPLARRLGGDCQGRDDGAGERVSQCRRQVERPRSFQATRTARRRRRTGRRPRRAPARREPHRRAGADSAARQREQSGTSAAPQPGHSTGAARASRAAAARAASAVNRVSVGGTHRAWPEEARRSSRRHDRVWTA